MSLEVILDMPVPCFDALANKVTRLYLARRLEEFYSAVYAAQGDSKGIKKWAKQWTKGLTEAGEAPQRPALTGDDFIATLGGKGGI